MAAILPNKPRESRIGLNSHGEDPHGTWHTRHRFQHLNQTFTAIVAADEKGHELVPAQAQAVANLSPTAVPMLRVEGHRIDPVMDDHDLLGIDTVLPLDLAFDLLRNRDDPPRG